MRPHTLRLAAAGAVAAVALASCGDNGDEVGRIRNDWTRNAIKVEAVKKENRGNIGFSISDCLLPATSMRSLQNFIRIIFFLLPILK